jgi:predicted transcriptional regulator
MNEIHQPITCFKADELTKSTIDKIAKRHRRNRANMLSVFIEAILHLEKSGELDSWLLETLNGEGKS